MAARIRPIALPPFTVGVYAISAVCGLLDAASFLKLGLVFVEIMTGNIVLLAFSVGTRGTHELASAIPTGWPYVAALACFAVGAVLGGRLVRAGETGRRIGFASDASLIGLAALVVALIHPGPVGNARYLVIAILAFAMGIQNALLLRWGIRDLATNLMTLTLARLLADSTPGGGDNPRAGRRSASIVIFTISAVAGAFMTRYGVLWPILAAFAVFALALPMLCNPRPSDPARQPRDGDGRRCDRHARPAGPDLSLPRFCGYVEQPSEDYTILVQDGNLLSIVRAG